MRVSKNMVIETASNIADNNGLSGVSLKTVAESLNIKTPSLYNHIKSLEELLREVAHNGMRTMNERMVKIAVGKTGKEAIQSVSIEYLNYMIEHPGIYETIQWASWHGTEETTNIYNDYLSLLTTLIQSCNLNENYTLEILNMLTGIIHGYTTLQLRNAFSEPEKVRMELADVVDTLLTGIFQKYK